MSNVSSSIYLMSVLAADTGMLLGLFLVWLESLGYPINHLPVVCRVNVYLSYVFGFLSIWYVVCITVETFITICHPTKIKQMCTLFRARAVALVLFITALVLYVMSPIITQVQPVTYHSINRTFYQCKTLDKYQQHEKIVSYVDTVLTLLVPMILLIILLTLMTLSIIQSIQKKQQRSIKRNIENGNDKGGSFTRKLPQVRVAKMLYILSVSVVVLNAPSHVLRLKFMFSQTQSLGEAEGLLHLILLFISYTSFSVKFFICIACSKNFRKLFLNSCCRYGKLKYRSVPQQTMETAA
ncbi:taste receptor type 2 member 109-like isoform X2 [Mercenaria mercenaria]|uniref:taste receptor type 2 member 109-like isoform X2 n=1 Tax=Mercenaria mercenaria TaxID=6596 RepID=UPI00234EA993|nr:taste receptor type 2 member 109-like isoform X2 [Mercenaria mercenaria]